jgi:hypothetical protein
MIARKAPWRHFARAPLATPSGNADKAIGLYSVAGSALRSAVTRRAIVRSQIAGIAEPIPLLF